MARLIPAALGSAVLVLALTGAAAADPEVTIFLNRDGGTLTGGWDDSGSDVSSVVLGAGGDVTVPAWQGGDRRWAQVTACVRERLADFDVDVVTTRPRGGDYQMVMVGGQPWLFGYPEGIGGIAPYTGEVLPDAVGFVFAESFEHDVESTCVGILHEAGHMLGLDHTLRCEDPMSYLWGCGEKRFDDVDAACGETEERTCGDGEPTQSSYRRLAAAVGLRDAPEEAAPVEDPAEDPVDDAAPSVAIEPGADELAGDQWIEVVVRAADDSGIAEVELGWASEDAQYVFACSAIPDDVPVTCARDGDSFRFQLFVGTGVRAMVARATDPAGNQTVSEARVLYLIGG